MKTVQRSKSIVALISVIVVLAEAPAPASQDAGLTLSAPVWTNGQVQFALSCEAGVTYVIQRSADFLNWAPVLTNSSPDSTRIITVGAPGSAGFYRAARGALSATAAALAASSTIDLKGNNITADSFDSADTNYSNGGLYPFGNLDKTKASGDISTEASLTDSLGVGSAAIKGTVRSGPGTNTIQIGANGSVGDRAWVEGGHLGIQPGHSASDFDVVFPDVLLPFTTWVPASKISGGTNIAGKTYDYAFFTSGDWRITRLNGSVYIGPNAVVRLYVTDNNASLGGNSVLAVAPSNSFLQLFMAGTSFSTSGNAGVDNQSGRARFFLFGLPTCTAITLGGNTTFIGCIYAPQANLVLGGGGAASQDFIGSSFTKTVQINGRFNFHYDENLRRVGPTR